MHNHDRLDLNEKQKLLFQKEHVHQIYPEYYLIKVNQFNDVAKNTLDEWIYFLKNEEIKDDFHAKGLLEAKEKLDSLKLPEPEKQEYKKYLENLRYQKSMVVSNYNDGKIEGKLESKIEIAKNMKDAGMPKETIQQITGLSIDEIDRIF
jgi:predicted transposase/invertase (TIGR01784 family)